MRDVYFSVDIETDGPLPSQASMLSFGIIVAGEFDGTFFANMQHKSLTFSRELKPVMTEFDQTVVKDLRIDREHYAEYGTHPVEAMTDAADWVRSIAIDKRPVFLGYAASFDWMFMQHYFMRYSRTGSPFLHSSVYDIKTMYAAKSRVTFSEAIRTRMPRELTDGLISERHDAMEDARLQAELFTRLFDWNGKS
jgi:hypothetical protein